MMYRITSNPEYDAAFIAAKDIAQTLYDGVMKHWPDISDMHTRQEWQMALRMLGSKLLRPGAGFQLPEEEDV